MLSLLDLFTPARPLLTAEEMAGQLGCSAATAYRYAADLCGAGLLARFSASFMLGPRIIELDYLIREHDPLLGIGLPLLRNLRDRTGCDVMVTEMLAEGIITVHHERGTDPTTVSFSRGRPLPLFRGAGSKAILAFLPPVQQRKLFERHVGEAAAAGLGETWPAFRAALSELRKEGHAISCGELDPQNVGIGAPLLHGIGAPPGSIVAVMSRTRWDLADQSRVTAIVKRTADEISALLRRPPGSDDPFDGGRPMTGGTRS